jgi:hypothetical protein
VVPHINIRSPPLRPGKFVVGEIKGLLQHYLPIGDTSITPVYKDKNNVMAATLTRLTNKADTSGTITKALGDGP